MVVIIIINNIAATHGNINQCEVPVVSMGALV